MSRLAIYDILISLSQPLNKETVQMKKMGRPKSDTHAVLLRISEAMLQEIDDLRRIEADVPTRPEMIRRILADWLEQKSQFRE